MRATTVSVVLAWAVAGAASAQEAAKPEDVCLSNPCSTPGAIVTVKDQAALDAAVKANDMVAIIKAGGQPKQALTALIAQGGFPPNFNDIDLASARYVTLRNGRPGIGYYSATGLRQAYQGGGVATAIESIQRGQALPTAEDAFPQVAPGSYRPVEPVTAKGRPASR